MRRELCSMGYFYPRRNNASPPLREGSSIAWGLSIQDEIMPPPPLRDWSYIAYCLSIQHGLDVLSLEVAKLDCYLSYGGDIV